MRAKNRWPLVHLSSQGSHRKSAEATSGVMNTGPATSFRESLEVAARHLLLKKRLVYTSVKRVTTAYDNRAVNLIGRFCDALRDTVNL